MTPKRLICLPALLLTLGMMFCAVNVAAAIPKAEKKQLKKARKHLQMGEYEEAKAAYDALIKINGNNSGYWFEAGLAYYNSQVDKEESVKYFERARTFKTKDEDGNMVADTIGETFYYLGRAYQYMGRFDEAIVEYNDFKDFVKANTKKGGVLARDVDRYITQCNNGKKFATTKDKEITVENLGNKVNSVWSEYAPVINEEQTILIFTARRADNTGSKNYHDNRKYEDIWVSVLENDAWSNASQFDSTDNYISSKINSKYHDAAVAYNYDETILYIYRRNDVWKSTLDGGKWSEPLRMNNNVNTQGHEPSVFISPDGNTLFVVSNRKEGFGGRDIFMSEKQGDGTWGEVKNLGAKINSEFDEDAPFLSKDGKYFYFSSNGVNSIGGYDVFKCEIDENGNWGDPVNLGMPINTAGDDIYYTELSEQNVAYLSSSRPYGFGHMDIYEVELECKPIPNTEIRGLLVHGENLEPIGGKILVTDNETGENVGEYTVNASDGKYLMILPPGKSYHMKVEAGDYLPHNADVFVPKQCDYYQLYQEIQVKYLKDTSLHQLYPQKAVFNNAFFDVKSETEKYYDIENLEDNINEPNDRLVNIVATVHHNDVVPGDEVHAYLLNGNNEIVQTSRTNEDGTVKFTDIDPSKEYKILIDETTLKISYNGDNPNNPENVKAMGYVFYDKIGGDPAKIFPVMLADDNMKVIDASKTDIDGRWEFRTLPIDHPDITAMNRDYPYRYNVEANDIDKMYSAFIKIIDTATTEIQDYSEVVDIISIEDIELWWLENGNDSVVAGLPEFEDILFDFDRYFLRDRSKEVLDEILAYMKEHPEVNLNIAGHTDWKGSEEYNIRLSRKRTQSAYNYLVKNGIDKRRLTTEHFGETVPTAANANPDGSDNPEGRQLNRRCELTLVSPSTSFTFSF